MPVGPGIRWLADGPASGYGDAAAAYISALREAGVPVTWTPLGWPSESWQVPHGPVLNLAPHELTQAQHRDIANREIEHDVVVVHAPALWSEQLEVEAAGRMLASYCTWETDRLPPEWVPILNRHDRVLVPSNFNREVFVASGVRVPVYVVPHLVAGTLQSAGSLASEDRATAGREGDGFLFYVIGTWTTRKALEDVVAAYLTAFSVHDEVTLLIHTTPEDRIAGARLGCNSAESHPPQASTSFALARLLAVRAYPPRIVLSTDSLNGEDMRRLHARGGCLVSLSRGEGWGLTAFEAGAAGNPTIITGWGGSLDFVPDGYPYLVDYDLIPTVDDEPDEWWLPRADERWAKARIEHAASLMRHVFEHRGEARSWGAALQRHILERFSAPVVTDLLMGALGIANPNGAARRDAAAPQAFRAGSAGGPDRARSR